MYEVKTYDAGGRVWRDFKIGQRGGTRIQSQTRKKNKKTWYKRKQNIRIFLGTQKEKGGELSF